MGTRIYWNNLFERLSGSEDGDLGHARSAELTWCTCSFCASMPRLKESTCCLELDHYATEHLSDNAACITCNEDFALICLNQLVLEMPCVTFWPTKDRINYFMINFHESIGPGQDQTCDPLICSSHASVARHVIDCAKQTDKIMDRQMLNFLAKLTRFTDNHRLWRKNMHFESILTD